MAIGEVTKSKSLFDNMNLSLFAVEPGDRVLDTKIVLSGPGHPRAIVVSASASKLFELVGGLLSACGKLDPEATERALRGALAHVAVPQDPAAASSTEAAPGDSPAEDEPTPELADFIKLAKTIQNYGRKSGLSDHAIGALISSVMGGRSEEPVSGWPTSSNGAGHDDGPA